MATSNDGISYLSSEVQKDSLAANKGGNKQHLETLNINDYAKWEKNTEPALGEITFP